MECRVLPTTVVCADRQSAERVLQWLAQVDTHWAQMATIVDGEIACDQWLVDDGRLLPTGLLVVDAAVLGRKGQPLWRELLPWVAVDWRMVLERGGMAGAGRSLLVLVGSMAEELAAIAAGAIDALAWSSLDAAYGMARLQRSRYLIQGVMAGWGGSASLLSPHNATGSQTAWADEVSPADEQDSALALTQGCDHAPGMSGSWPDSWPLITASCERSLEPEPEQPWLEVLNQVLNNTIDGMLIVNHGGRICYANPAACKLFGRSKAELLGEHLGIPIATDAATEVDILHPDGTLGVGDLNVSAIEWLGEPAYAVAIRDVSYRKQVEADLRYRLSLESVVAYVARLLVTADDDVRFGSVLAAVGRAMGVDHVLLLHGSPDRPLMNLACEWHDAHRSPVAKAFNMLGGKLPPSWRDQLNRTRAVMIGARHSKTREDLDQQAEQWLDCLRADSLLITAIHDRQDSLWGALVLCTEQARSWLEQDVQILQTIGDTIYAWYDRQATQDRLRASEALYSSIFERSDERIFLVNVQPSGGFTYETVNPAFERALEHRAAHIIGRSPQELFPPSCATPIVARFRACVAGRDTIRCEETLLIRGRQRIWHTSLVPIRDAWNRVVKLLGSARDITQEREATLQRENQSRYRQLLASISFKIRQSLDISVILGRTVSELRKTLKADRVMFYRCQADGSSAIAAEAISPPFNSLNSSPLRCCTLSWDTQKSTHPHGLDHYWKGEISLEEDLTQLKLSSSQRKYIKTFSIRSQVVVPVTISAVNLSPGELGFVPMDVLADQPQPATVLLGLLCLQQCQNSRHWTSFEVDLLQQLAGQLSIALYQARLLEERTKAIEDLARSNEQLQQFAYVASHDLQEPLRGIIAFSEILGEEYGDHLDSSAKEYLQFIIDSGQRMRQLIRDLLAFSRVETRGSSLKPVDCNQVLEMVLENLRAAIQDSQAAIQSDSLPTVLGDSAQLAQLLQNLLGNAIKFRGIAAPIIIITAHRQEHQWCFRIRDNGIGIDPQYADRIFHIFQRLHNREEYEGTGIGLAICRKIVERHGGAIGVESQPGEGATFWFTLPDPPDS